MIINGEFVAHLSKSRWIYLILGPLVLAGGIGALYFAWFSGYVETKSYVRFLFLKYAGVPVFIYLGLVTTWIGFFGGPSPLVIARVSGRGISWRTVMLPNFRFIPWNEIDYVEIKGSGNLYAIHFQKKNVTLFDRLFGGPAIHQQLYKGDIEQAAAELQQIPEFKQRWRDRFG